jgi:hypothetical protein
MVSLIGGGEGFGVRKTTGTWHGACGARFIRGSAVKAKRNSNILEDDENPLWEDNEVSRAWLQLHANMRRL